MNRPPRAARSRVTTFDTLAGKIGGEAVTIERGGAKTSVEQAISHCFERKSVEAERMVLAQSIKRAIGTASRKSVEREFARNPDLVIADRDGRRMATTTGVLKEEMKMLAFARNGRGTESRLGNGDYQFRNQDLNDDQRRAVEHILGSRDKVMLVRGKAGVGKSYMLVEAAKGIEDAGKKVFAFAPSADASRVSLRKDGFVDADTVARLLLDEKLQEAIKGNVIFIDEAGLLGTVTMSKVFDLAEKLDARIVLCGDIYQHGSVERGAALRLLETESGLKSAEIKEIQRQRGDYEKAVRHLSEGRTEKGFEQLDQLGWIREVPLEERYKVLADDYIETVASGKTALIVSPTHFEGEHISRNIRKELQERGTLSKEEHTFRTFVNTSLTEAERADAASYLPDTVIEFHQNAKGYRKGQRLKAGDAPLPIDQAARFQAYHTRELSIAAGDLIRVTKNGKTADGKHVLNNRSRYEVKGFDDQGNIVLRNGWKIAQDYGHISHGYVVTSVASQGSTVDRVFIGQSPTLGASSREQFYVSASRARHQMTLYTESKQELLEAVKRSDERLTATELVNEIAFRDRHEAVRRQERLAGIYKPEISYKDRIRKEMVHDR